jgi:hypothetical protein
MKHHLYLLTGASGGCTRGDAGAQAGLARADFGDNPIGDVRD